MNTRGGNKGLWVRDLHACKLYFFPIADLEKYCVSEAADFEGQELDESRQAVLERLLGLSNLVKRNIDDLPVEPLFVGTLDVHGC